MGNAAFDELSWWSKEFGNYREWTYGSSMNTDTMEYDHKLSNVSWKFVPYLKKVNFNLLEQKIALIKLEVKMVSQWLVLEN